MKKKIIIGISIAVVVLLIGILTYGEVTGKFSLFGRKTRSGTTTFCALSYPSFNVEERTNQGIVADDVEWKSVSYAFLSQQTITITRYRGVNMETLLEGREGYQDATIGDLQLKYLQTTLDQDGFVLDQYYTQIGNNTYYFSSTYRNITENHNRFTNFISGLTVGIEPEDVEEPGEPVDPENP